MRLQSDSLAPAFDLRRLCRAHRKDVTTCGTAIDDRELLPEVVPGLDDFCRYQAPAWLCFDLDDLLEIQSILQSLELVCSSGVCGLCAQQSLVVARPEDPCIETPFQSVHGGSVIAETQFGSIVVKEQ